MNEPHYPLVKIPSDTPETDHEESHHGGDEYHHEFIRADFARRLERERNEERATRDRYKAALLAAWPFLEEDRSGFITTAYAAAIEQVAAALGLPTRELPDSKT